MGKGESQSIALGSRATRHVFDSECACFLYNIVADITMGYSVGSPAHVSQDREWLTVHISFLTIEIIVYLFTDTPLREKNT